MLEPVWMWGILGLALLALEMAAGTFYILWFGVSALCLCVAVGLFPTMPIAMQFFMFAALSIGSLAIWKLNYKSKLTLRVGQSKGEEIGRIGTIIQSVSAKQNGVIQFPQGVMGSREWAAIADEAIEAGADAVIVGVEGNALRVKPSNH